MNNEFRKEFHLSVGEEKVFSYLDIEDNHSLYTLDFFIPKEASLKINFSIFSSTKKDVNINIHHESNDSYSECICYGVSKKNSISFILNTYINDKTFGNNCKQEIHGLLLSDEARVSGNPNLIIDTNKIKASHKLAIGSFNKDYLFYVKSKGINSADAKILLANKFYQDHLRYIDDESKREKILKMIEGYFNYGF